MLNPSSLFAVLVAVPFASHAALVTINNPSFESPTTAGGVFTGTQTTGPTDWIVYNTIPANGTRYFGVWNPATTNSYADPVPHGSNIGVVFLDNPTPQGEAGLQQTLATTLQLSTQYTLTLSVGNFGTNPSDPWNFAGFPGYRVDLMADAVVIASDNNTLAPGEGRFLTSTVSFTTGASHPNVGQAIGIRLVSLNGSGVEVNFDNVQLDVTPVPEPSNLVIVSFVGLALAAVRRRA